MFRELSGFEFACLVGGEPGEALLDPVDLAGDTGRVQTVTVRGQFRSFLCREYPGAYEPVERGRKLVVDASAASFGVGVPPDRFLRRSEKIVAVANVLCVLSNFCEPCVHKN